MDETAATLRAKLIRNVNDPLFERQRRNPLYDIRCGGESANTVTMTTGAGFGVLASSKRSPPATCYTLGATPRSIAGRASRKRALSAVRNSTQCPASCNLANRLAPIEHALLSHHRLTSKIATLPSADTSD